MWRCPVCEKEHMQGLVCDGCGFDCSCDYEQNRTLCSALPRRTEPISVRAAKWRQQQKQTVAVSPGDPPVTVSASAKTNTAPTGIDKVPEQELTAIICVHCGLVNPDTNYVCDHCAKRLWRYSDPNAPQSVFLFGFRGFVRRYDHINVDAVPLPDAQSTKPSSKKDTVETQPALQKKSQSGSTESLIAWGRSKEEQEQVDRAFDILMGKS